MSAPSAGLLRRLGVSRLARVGALDRSDLPVACAVRPRGHVLQVCNGKGLTESTAAWSAAMEAAELWASERMPRDLHWGSPPDRQRAWGPERLPASARLRSGALWTRVQNRPWRLARCLEDDGPVWVPAAAVTCSPPGSSGIPDLGIAWTSNGLGAHPGSMDLALRHALLELIERDLLHRVLPEGWTEAAVAAHAVHPRALEDTPAVAARVEQLGTQGLDARLFDLDPRSAHGVIAVPLAGALVFDVQRDVIPLTAGYAAGTSREEARLGALLEAVQSRVTDTHGAREDVAPMRGEDARRLRAACAAPAVRSTSRPARRREDPGGAGPVMAAVHRAGFEHVGVVELASLDEGVAVVRAFVPGLRRSELL
ncbi:MAG TPA: YcaO-like family protein [Myxococcaceae bacterium]|nr:YcaO-like family protein [Myxococcaceae bacterium]